MLKFSFQFAQMIWTVKNSILARMENAVSYLWNIRKCYIFCLNLFYILTSYNFIPHHILNFCTECLDKGQCRRFATEEACTDTTNPRRLKWIQERCPKTCGVCGNWYVVNRWWITVMNLIFFISINNKPFFCISFLFWLIYSTYDYHS